MPQLPEIIYKRRLESEFQEMSQSNIKFKCNADKTRYSIELNEPYEALENGKLLKKTSHLVEIALKRSYPYPGGFELQWKTPIFHPNIRDDGKVCIQLVNEWSESQTIKSVCQALVQLLKNPNPLSPLNKKAAEHYIEKNPSMFERIDKNGPRVIE